MTIITARWNISTLRPSAGATGMAEIVETFPLVGVEADGVCDHGRWVCETHFHAKP